MEAQKTVLGKLNVLLVLLCHSQAIWKTLKLLAVEVKDRILLRKCKNRNYFSCVAIIHEVSGDDQLPLLILVVGVSFS